jgi:hypothetical protein
MPLTRTIGVRTRALDIRMNNAEISALLISQHYTGT